MISATELIKQYHALGDFKNDDMLNIEKAVIKAASGGFREITFGVLTERYSTATNNLKELGYKVVTESQANNITVLKITW